MHGLILLDPWSSCACATLVQSRQMGTHKGGGGLDKARVVRRQHSSPRGNQIKIATFSECQSMFEVIR